jgi:hypothetical protein
MSKIHVSTRPANCSRILARSLPIEKAIRFRGDRRDFALELAASITRRARRPVLIFTNFDAHGWLLEFVRRGGNIRLIQILPMTSIADLPDWAEQWGAGLMILDRDDHVFLLTRVELTDAPIPGSIRGRRTARCVQSQRGLRSFARTQGQRR